MKKIIIAAITLAMGATAFVLTRSTDRRKHRRPMRFRELYEDNLCDGGSLFD